jgi:splicing factor 3B subunit 2
VRFIDCAILQRKNGVDVAIDSSELEGLSEDQLRAKYEAASRGNAGVPGAGTGEDFGDMIAREMAKKKQKMDNKTRAKEKGYKF